MKIKFIDEGGVLGEEAYTDKDEAIDIYSLADTLCSGLWQGRINLP